MLAGGLAATAPAMAGTSAARTVAVPKWGKCAESDLQQAGAQCAMLSVPLNYSHPGGPTIKIAVSRIKHTSSHYQGVILTNPGGPGGSGLDLNVFLIAQLKAEGSPADKAAVADYDWIGFDPRGVGASVPALTCEPNYFSGDRASYDPTNKKILHYWLTRSARYAHKCQTHSAKAAKNLVALYRSSDGTGNDNGFAVYNAVQCTDVQWPLSWAKWDRDNTRVNRTAPFEGSLYIRKLFPHSVLLAEPGGTTHADSLSGNLCVDNTIANYLARGRCRRASRTPSGTRPASRCPGRCRRPAPRATGPPLRPVAADPAARGPALARGPSGGSPGQETHRSPRAFYVPAHAHPRHAPVHSAAAPPSSG